MSLPTRVSRLDFKDGVVTAKAGKATIVAADESGKYASCVVTVTEAKEVTGVTLNKSSLNLGVGGSKSRDSTSADATNKQVTWLSLHQA